MVMSYYLYILQSEVKETFYVGSSDNPKRRELYHNGESKGYTKRYRPWKVVYTLGFESKELAQKAERKVKSWKSKKMIQFLISGKIDITDYV